MSEKKKCPMDRGKLLIGLECCRKKGKCKECPYRSEDICFDRIAFDALAYIGWLEELLEGVDEG